MSQPLSVSVGQASSSGVKPVNQDAIAYLQAKEPQLSNKGMAFVMADGISSSSVSDVASQTAVSSFINDYYCTSEAWSVKTSAQKVIHSINSWLYAQTRNSPYRFNKDKGYVCTFSALILKSNTAHLFHCGDTRIYRISGDRLELLTEDHRRIVSTDVSYLSRALGIDKSIEVDYQSQGIDKGDTFIIATDGVYEFITEKSILAHIINADNLDNAAKNIIASAIEEKSDDNLSVQIVRIDHVPSYQLDEVQQQIEKLRLPPELKPRMQLDEYEILRELYISSRSHVFLAKNNECDKLVVIKIPSVELRHDTQYLERFMLEEWIAKRIDNPHVVKAIMPKQQRQYLYLVTEYVEGMSLAQWMIDNPKPTLEQVRGIIEQIANGLQAFHRQEMIHQDIRPQNIIINSDNIVKIIDFGSTFIGGVNDEQDTAILGTMRYSAPEYFLGQGGSAQSDIYSLGVMAYQMLSGRFPYTNKIAQAKSLSAQRRLKYQSVLDDDSEVPVWIDDALQQCLQTNPLQRYHALSEFIHDLRQPNRTFIQRTRPPLIEKNPLRFWQSLSFSLLVLVVYLLSLLIAK